MARVHFVKAARKDNPVAKVGEPYYWWAFRTGGKHYSKTPPRRSQLTQSEKLGRAYELSERLEDIERDGDSTEDSLQEAVENAVTEFQLVCEEVRELADEYRESAESIRNSFAESPTADECDEKADSLESWADEIESAMQELEGIDFSDADFDLEDAASTFHSALESADSCPL